MTGGEKVAIHHCNVARWLARLAGERIDLVSRIVSMRCLMRNSRRCRRDLLDTVK
jgi:hypothetical protein